MWMALVWEHGYRAAISVRVVLYKVPSKIQGYYVLSSFDNGRL